MLTAARLVAGVMFAILAWYVSELIKPLFPEGRDVGRFSEVNAAISFVVGWRIAGTRAPAGWGGAVSYGLTATFFLTLWCLFLQSFGVMITQSLRKAYDGPIEAIIGVFELMVEHALIMADVEVIGTLVVGGVIAALVVEWSGRRWR